MLRGAVRERATRAIAPRRSAAPGHRVTAAPRTLPSLRRPSRAATYDRAGARPCADDANCHPRVISRSSALGSASAVPDADPGDRGRAADPRVPRARARGGRLHGRRRAATARGSRAGGRATTYDLVVLDLLLAAARRPERAARAAAAHVPELPVVIVSRRAPTCRRSCAGFGLGACDYSAQAVLVRRAARARSARSCAARRRRRRARRAARRRARRSTSRGGRRGSASVVAELSDREFRVLHHLVAAPGRGRQPRAAALRGLGLPLRPALERRRRLRPAAAQEARRGGADRDRAPCGLSAYCGVTGSSSRGRAFAVANLVAMVLVARAGRRSRSTSSGSA